MLSERRGQRLDGDVAAEPRVARAIHFAHAARAERRDNLVGAEAAAGGDPHGLLSAVGQFMSMTIAGAAACSTLIVARNRR